MFDVRSAAIPIHQFGWRVRQHTPTPFTDAGDDRFSRLVKRRTRRMMNLVPNGIICRNYLSREPVVGAVYEIVTSIDTPSGALIPEDQQDIVRQNVLNMLGDRWNIAVSWAARLTYTERTGERILRHLYANGGEMPAIRWMSEATELPELTIEERGGRLTILLSEVPAWVPFPACVQKIIQRGTVDTFLSQLQLPTPAEA